MGGSCEGNSLNVDFRCSLHLHAVQSSSAGSEVPNCHVSIEHCDNDLRFGGGDYGAVLTGAGQDDVLVNLQRRRDLEGSGSQP